jgi:hypothetical protein
MDIGLLFWILMILWIVSTFGTWYQPSVGYWSYGSSLFQLVLFFLLGWQVFGPMLRASGRG